MLSWMFVVLALPHHRYLDAILDHKKIEQGVLIFLELFFDMSFASNQSQSLDGNHVLSSVGCLIATIAMRKICQI
jgi:hypothetical protein